MRAWLLFAVLGCTSETTSTPGDGSVAEDVLAETSAADTTTVADTPVVMPSLASELSQYGITWKFDKAYPSGRFVNGDHWVVGPITVVSITPAPTAPAEQWRGEIDGTEQLAVLGRESRDGGKRSRLADARRAAPGVRGERLGVVRRRRIPRRQCDLGHAAIGTRTRAAAPRARVQTLGRHLSGDAGRDCS